jgi:putative oxidoreductase
MSNHTDSEHAPPVAMQHGRHVDRTALARLRAERRWLVRAQDKAGLVADPMGAALLLLRVAVGVTFFLHGADKLGDLPGTEQFFASLGIPAPGLTSLLVALTEVIGGLLLVAGLGTALVGAALAGDMAVAYLTAHVGNGFFVKDGGGELVLLLAAVSLALALAGPGRYRLWRDNPLAS